MADRLAGTPLARLVRTCLLSFLVVTAFSLIVASSSSARGGKPAGVGNKPAGVGRPTGETNPAAGTSPVAGTNPVAGANPVAGTKPVRGVKPVGGIQPGLSALAARSPRKLTSVIVQFQAGTSPAEAEALVKLLGGRDLQFVPLIEGIAARMPAGAAQRLSRNASVRAVSINGRVKPRSLVNFDPNKMASAYNQSAKTSNVWNAATGKGVGVAVIDTGVAGGLPDFRTSPTNATSRVVASVVTNPTATTSGDSFGHGTHVAGIIAGNDGYRPTTDPLFGKYAGAAPDANLVSIKAGGENGDATVLDVIYGLQFAVDHKADYNIRVVNLSLESSQAQSYKTDPLDAAAEAAWFSGIVVVAAAGNRGTASDAVQYAPGNDPYVISVGAVDDKGTKGVTDDAIPSWSSRGVTQDGFRKPDIYAPGARIVSTLSPRSAFTSMCPSCVVSGQYIRAGGTSMAAPIIAGTVADILQVRPSWTPNMVKGALTKTMRTIVGGYEVDALNAYNASTDKRTSNAGLTPNTLINPTTGGIDYTRSRWSRSSWSTAPSSLTAGWARSSWSCDCSLTSSGSVDPTRSSWSRSSWSTSWTL